MTDEAPDWLAELAASLRRDADVPVGVQLAWALRARVVRGDLRDVAAALYMRTAEATPASEAEERRRLRAQVAALERAVNAQLRLHPEPADEQSAAARRRSDGPRLLTIAQLEEIRDDLLGR